MMKKNIYALFLLIVFAGCSGKNVMYQKVSGNDNADIELKSLYVWVDKMPGSNRSNNLKLSADLIIEESDNYNFSLLKLNKIIILQDSLLVYNFKPVVKDNPLFNKKGKRNIIISTLEKTDLPEIFDINKEIIVRFIFEYKDKKFINTFNKIKVDVTY